eukprot:Nk52_evm3s1837 gene=Nk52_evmTU3s1837
MDQKKTPFAGSSFIKEEDGGETRSSTPSPVMSAGRGSRGEDGEDDCVNYDNGNNESHQQRDQQLSGGRRTGSSSSSIGTIVQGGEGRRGMMGLRRSMGGEEPPLREYEYEKDWDVCCEDQQGRGQEKYVRGGLRCSSLSPSSAPRNSNIDNGSYMRNGNYSKEEMRKAWVIYNSSHVRCSFESCLDLASIVDADDIDMMHRDKAIVPGEDGSMEEGEECPERDHEGKMSEGYDGRAGKNRRQRQGAFVGQNTNDEIFSSTPATPTDKFVSRPTGKVSVASGSHCSEAMSEDENTEDEMGGGNHGSREYLFKDESAITDDAQPIKRYQHMDAKTLGILKEWLQSNAERPFLSEANKVMLMKKTGLTKERIVRWLANARRFMLNRHKDADGRIQFSWKNEGVDKGCMSGEREGDEGECGNETEAPLDEEIDGFKEQNTSASTVCNSPKRCVKSNETGEVLSKGDQSNAGGSKRERDSDEAVVPAVLKRKKSKGRASGEGGEKEVTVKQRKWQHLEKSTTQHLKKWLYEHLDAPFPSDVEKMRLMGITGLSKERVTKWFCDARSKLLKRIVDQDGKVQYIQKPRGQRIATNKSPNMLDRSVTDLLKKWLFEHIDNPFPSEEERTALCMVTGLSRERLNRWFAYGRHNLLVRGVSSTGGWEYSIKLGADIVELEDEKVKVLVTWLLEHLNEPFPNRTEKIMLCEGTGLSRDHLSQWLANARNNLLTMTMSKDGKMHFEPKREKINSLVGEEIC